MLHSIRHPKKHIVALIIVALALLITPTLSQAEKRDPQTHFFNDSFGDMTEELDIASDENKQGIMLFFEMDECPFCHRMKKTVFSEKAIQDFYRKHFRIISVDIEGDIEIVDFKGNDTTQKQFAQDEHRVRATPVTAFYDLEGNKLYKITGPVLTDKDFMLLGQYIIDKEYTKQSFRKYKRAHR